MCNIKCTLMTYKALLFQFYWLVNSAKRLLLTGKTVSFAREYNKWTKHINGRHLFSSELWGLSTASSHTAPRARQAQLCPTSLYDVSSPKAESVSSELQSGDNFRPPQTVLFPPERINLNWAQQFNVGAGLENVGNTCYLNSALQCLTYTPPFANYMLSQEHSATCNDVLRYLRKKHFFKFRMYRFTLLECHQDLIAYVHVEGKKHGFCMMCTMQAHISEVFKKSGDTITPVKVLAVLNCKYNRKAPLPAHLLVIQTRTDSVDQSLTCLTVIANHFHFGRQEDAHEFLQCTLEAMQESCLAESK